jgi:hypothetical protein
MSVKNGCPDPNCDNPECPGAAAHGPLADLVKSIQAQANPKLEHITFLTTDEVKAWNDLQALGKEVQDKMMIFQTRRDLFWANIKMAYNLHGRTHMTVDPKTTELKAAEKKEDD